MRSLRASPALAIGPAVMDEDIAVRLANEGVPVRAIARIVQLPSAEVREQLEAAKYHGYLIEIPGEDWPIGLRRERRLRHLAKLVANKPSISLSQLQAAIRTTYKLSPVELQILLILLSNTEVHRTSSDLLATNDLRATSLHVNVSRLRRRLAPFGLKIGTLYGDGYHMSAVDRRRTLSIVLEKAFGAMEKHQQAALERKLNIKL